MDEWEKTLLPEKENGKKTLLPENKNFFIDLNIHDFTDAD